MVQKKKHISYFIILWLLVIVLSASLVSAVLYCLYYANRAEKQGLDMVRQNVEDVSKDIGEMADEAIMSNLREVIDSHFITTANLEDPDALTEQLSSYYNQTGVEINVINSEGVIVASGIPDYVGFDLHEGKVVSELLVLLDGSKEELIQDLRGDFYNQTKIMKYAGKRFADGSGFLELGLSEEQYFEAIASTAKFATTNRRIGRTGYLLVCDSEFNIINSYHNSYTGMNLKTACIPIETGKEYHYQYQECEVLGEPSYACINQIRDLYVIGVYPEHEAKRNVYIMINGFVALEMLVFAFMFIVLIIMLKKMIVNNIVKVNNSLTAIVDGNLDERIDIRDSYEFDSLSNGINATVDKLKDYISEAEARIDADLAVAKEIQSSALPSLFPPFPERTEFELFASMHAAKEVGGDFYDFYLLGNTLAIMIADVSGKSVPGAMFMMKAKGAIKSLAESGLPPSGIFTIANQELCEGNDAEMFLTAWLGFLDLDTGIVHVANAGHNPPVLVRDGKAELLKLKPNLMLAEIEDVIYKEHTVQLQKGDILYLYTDGVTEAMNAAEDLYGEKRLLELLSFGDNYPEPDIINGTAGSVCEIVSADINTFVDGVEQSDDITMLCIRYLGKETVE